MKGKIFSVLCATALALSVGKTEVQAKAEKYQTTSSRVLGFKSNESIMNVGKQSFMMKQEGKSWYRDGMLYQRRNNRWIKILKNINISYVANTKYIFYSKSYQSGQVHGSYNSRIYRYNIKTKKSTKILSGREAEVWQCQGNYLYYGLAGPIGEGEQRLKVYNLKTKKSRNLYDYAGSLQIANSKLLVKSVEGAGDFNKTAYLFDLDGRKKVRLPDSIYISIKNKKIYYIRVNDPRKGYYSKYSCSFNGKHKKLIGSSVTNLNDLLK